MLLGRLVVRSVPRASQPHGFYSHIRITQLYHPTQRTQYFAYSAKRNAESEWDSILDFWFNRDPKESFSPPPGLDKEIKSRFGHLVEQARANDLDSWANHPKGALCLVLLLDQFPRNIFRGSGDAFASDVQAQKVVTQAISKGFDKEIGKLSTRKQSFFYMPFMHAEDVLPQIAGKALYEGMAYSQPKGSEERKMYEQSIQFAERHLQCVCRFGRFPARNKALGRPNTEEEEIYLAENPIGF